MAMNLASGTGLLTPEEVGTLVVQPALDLSVAAQVASVVTTNASSYRVPIVTGDGTAAWTPEAQEITPSDAAIGEDLVAFKKLAALSILSRELVNDTDPSALAQVGQGLARDLARKIDSAYFASTTPNGPDGIGSITPTVIDTGATIGDTDPFAEAITSVEDEGATIGNWVAAPSTVLALLTLKDEANSNRPLLGTDPTSPTTRSILGIPLRTSRYITDGVVWGIPTQRTLLVMRENTTIETSTDAYFSSDQVAVKVTARLGFSFPHQAAIAKLHDAP